MTIAEALDRRFDDGPLPYSAVDVVFPCEDGVVTVYEEDAEIKALLRGRDPMRAYVTRTVYCKYIPDIGHARRAARYLLDQQRLLLGMEARA